MKALIIAGKYAQKCKICGMKHHAKGLCKKHYGIQQAAEYYLKHKAQRAKTLKMWYEKNKEQFARYSAAWYQKNRDRVLLNERIRRAESPDEFRERARKWREKNRGKTRGYIRRYQAQQLQATPKWADKNCIQEIYDLAVLKTKVLGISHEVDHIVPLQSELVCGLHVEDNLCVLPRSFNIKKGNRSWPGMWL